MKLLEGVVEVQVSGWAFRWSSSLGWRRAISWPFILVVVVVEELVLDRRFCSSRLRWAIWRAAGILLLAHIQAYLSERLMFCLSRSL